MYKILTTNGVVTGSWTNTDYVAASTVPGHPFISSSNAVAIPAGTNEFVTPNSGSDGWNYSSAPTSDPNTKGSLWVDTTASYVLKVSQG